MRRNSAILALAGRPNARPEDIRHGIAPPDKPRGGGARHRLHAAQREVVSMISEFGAFSDNLRMTSCVIG
jgi:hypothetical protein